MARYFLHGFLLTLPALWLVLTMVFLLIHIVPGDPVEQMLGESAAPGQAAELRHTLSIRCQRERSGGNLKTQVPARKTADANPAQKRHLGHPPRFFAPNRG